MGREEADKHPGRRAIPAREAVFASPKVSPRSAREGHGAEVGGEQNTLGKSARAAPRFLRLKP